jgi:hypothetical protein
MSTERTADQARNDREPPADDQDDQPSLGSGAQQSAGGGHAGFGEEHRDDLDGKRRHGSQHQ